MNFANPAALWLLVLIIPLVLLYLLKHKRKEMIVPSIFLWKQAAEDLRAQTPFQKLKTNLLLFLQLLILGLITGFLAQPYLNQALHPMRRWILVIDSSASMKSVDERPDRFGAARQQLIRLLDSIPDSDEILLISFSSSASVLQPLSKNHSAVRSKLLRLQADDLPGDWQRLPLILQPLMKEKPRPRIVIASDFANCPAEFAEKLSFQALSVGRSSRNIGITRALLQPLPTNPENQILFYQIKNFDKQKHAVELQLTLNGELIDAIELELDPLQAVDRSNELRITEFVRIALQLKPADILPQDNDFVIFASPQEKAIVRMEMENPFLLKALQVLPSIEIAGPGLRPTSTDVIKIKAVDRTPEKADTGVFFMKASTAHAQNSSGEVVEWNSAHPAMRYVDAGLWKFAHPGILQMSRDAEVLVDTAEGPIAYAEDIAGKRKIVLGFALEDSNLFQLGGFPVFLQNCIHWIQDGYRKPSITTTGNNFPREGPFTINGRPGYANFADPKESDITPQRPGGNTGSEATNVRGRQDLSSFLLILLLAAIMLEWWAFHRRICPTT